jgi:VanZ family protein
VLYGISDEVHQHFVVARTAETMDVLADALGGSCGTFLYYIRSGNAFSSGGNKNRKRRPKEMKE